MKDVITLDQAQPEVQRKFMAGVYLRMVFALALTAATAYFIAYEVIPNPSGNPYFTYFRTYAMQILIGAAVVELAIVIGLSYGIRKLSPATAMFLFILYSFTTGITFSFIFYIYSLGSIFKVFICAALMFLGMSIYGMFTKADLRSAGRYLIMGLIGLVIAALMNILFRSSTLDWIISIVGVGIFVGLTAYDTQKLMTIGIYNDGSEKFQKYAIVGALELYLDFINIFLKLLRLFGKRR